tara:strand:+ start:671 stop:802 length:132 start_codon:yes stop_codon:yes gene_type:complete
MISLIHGLISIASDLDIFDFLGRVIRDNAADWNTAKHLVSANR